MKHLITIDPGRHAGVVWWRTGFIEELALITDFDVNECHIDSPDFDTIVCELPIAYSGARSKVNPNDLIKLAFRAGRLCGMGREVLTISPVSWKGTVPDEILYRRITKALSEPERALIKSANLPVSLVHNILDAVGIGLYVLGRMGTGGRSCEKIGAII